MEERTIKVPAISCHHCINTIKREIGSIEGVVSVEGDPGTKKLIIRWSPPADWPTILAMLVEIGYPPEE